MVIKYENSSEIEIPALVVVKHRHQKFSSPAGTGIFSYATCCILTLAVMKPELLGIDIGQFARVWNKNIKLENTKSPNPLSTLYVDF